MFMDKSTKNLTLIVLASVITLSIILLTDIGEAKTIAERIEGESSIVRASIKGKEISKIKELERTRRDKYEIEIVKMQSIRGGVIVFARAWENGVQIGFGSDGTVDIERFIIHNPPILVDDPNGEIIRTGTNSVTGEITERHLREDKLEALLQSLEHTISVKKEKFGPENIIAGKVGNTTSTFYPEAGSGVTAMDGAVYQRESGGVSWATLRAATGDLVQTSAAT